jgi:Mn-dependent DtxR family transcriptional regulator
MITLGQARYLLAICHIRGRDRTMTKIARELGVSKPSVTSMINSFEEKGFVKKSPALTLTAHGKAIADEIMSKQSVISAYFSRELGIAREETGNDALVLMFEMSERFVDSFIKKIVTDAARAKLREFSGNAYLSNFQGILPDGIYEIPFNLLKKSDSRLSMGDKGFMHPAKLVVTDGYGVISLRAVPMTHKALQGYTLKGMLARLYYWNGENYVEALEEDDMYSFPVMNMHWGYDQEKGMDFGVVQIKVQASVGVVNMPESLADLVIYLEAKNFLSGRVRVV